MSNSAFDPRHVAGDQSSFHTPPPSPVQQLRSKLRMMEDAIGRMMDASDIDLLGHAEISYLNQQLTHLGNYYVAAAAIVTSVAMCAHVASMDIDEWETGEVKELTLPSQDDASQGGAV